MNTDLVSETYTDTVSISEDTNMNTANYLCPSCLIFIISYFFFGYPIILELCVFR